MKEYDLYLPLNYNDGSPIEEGKLEQARRELIEEFGRLTHFPQPAEGLWMKGGELFRDAVVVYRVMTSDTRKARRFFAGQKERLKESLRQEDVLIVERDVGSV